MLSDWYLVTFDAKKIYRNVTPKHEQSEVLTTKPAERACAVARPPLSHEQSEALAPWNDSLNWNEIIKICFEANGGLEPDCIYIYSSTRPESYAIPLEASGAHELWDEILKRNLFDANLAIEAASSTNGLFCWPKHGAQRNANNPVPGESAEGRKECSISQSPTFPVHIIDHAHYQDADGEYTQGEYATLEEAQQACKTIINSELAALHSPGISAEELQKQFLLFGQEAYCEGFSGLDYAKLRCRFLCSGAST